MFKINAGEVIDVPAQQLAQQRSTPRVAAAAPVAPKEAREPAIEPPAPAEPPPAPRVTQTARVKPAAEALDREAVAPSGRPQGRGDRRDPVAPAAPPPAAAPPADDDWESSDERSASWH